MRACWERHARFSCFCRYIAIDLYKHVIICSLTEAIVGWRDRFNEGCSFFNKSIVYTSQLAMEMEATARVLKLLGDPTRLTILAILHKRECCVYERLVVFSTSWHSRKLAAPSGGGNGCMIRSGRKANTTPCCKRCCRTFRTKAKTFAKSRQRIPRPAAGADL
ncbi:hypothetical protein EP10_001754 [Geobacillus icigianus]|uniref:HTH arsR-type domain-containing protein n=1 Tax=Geobacillus icigianus TaxID=1430331 RepID=A0ABU6BG30_9BACL|nr:hypothetical protein [Geobacillus icigianus]